MPLQIPFITIQLLDLARAGDKHFIIRLEKSDYPDVQEAAKILGLRPAELARTLTVYGARAILREIKK